MDRFFIWAEITLITLLIWASIFWWFNKFPSIDSFKRFLESFDSKGGNIFILSSFSILGVFASIRLLYYIIQLSVDGKLAQDNSFALLTVQFMTSSVTGGFIGALLKTMSGDASAPVQVEEKGANDEKKS